MTRRYTGVRILEELYERAQNACYWVGQGLTVRKLIEDGLERVVSELEKKHNKGNPFKEREVKED
jgi:hypothetical protein